MLNNVLIPNGHSNTWGKFKEMSNNILTNNQTFSRNVHRYSFENNYSFSVTVTGTENQENISQTNGVTFYIRPQQKITFTLEFIDTVINVPTVSEIVQLILFNGEPMSSSWAVVSVSNTIFMSGTSYSIVEKHRLTVELECPVFDETQNNAFTGDISLQVFNVVEEHTHIPLCTIVCDTKPPQPINCIISHEFKIGDTWSEQNVFANDEWISGWSSTTAENTERFVWECTFDEPIIPAKLSHISLFLETTTLDSYESILTVTDASQNNHFEYTENPSTLRIYVPNTQEMKIALSNVETLDASGKYIAAKLFLTVGQKDENEQDVGGFEDRAGNRYTYNSLSDSTSAFLRVKTNQPMIQTYSITDTNGNDIFNNPGLIAVGTELHVSIDFDSYVNVSAIHWTCPNNQTSPSPSVLSLFPEYENILYSSTGQWKYIVQNNDSVVDRFRFILSNIKDQAGNDTSEVTIPPVLFDDEPVITVNDENTIPLYGKEGDAISLSFVPKIDILSASVFFANQPMSVVNANNGVWTATYSVTDTSPSTLPQGNATVQIVTTDQNGNLNGHSGMNQPVILDTIAVELQSLDVSTNNPVNSQYAKNQDVITLTVTVNEHLSEINGHFEGLDGADVPITFNQKNSANTVLIEWESSFEINDTNIDHGVELQFTIDYYDIAGNSGTFTQNDLTSENVTVDFIPPMIQTYSITDTNGNDIFNNPGLIAVGTELHVSIDFDSYVNVSAIHWTCPNNQTSPSPSVLSLFPEYENILYSSTGQWKYIVQNNDSVVDRFRFILSNIKDQAGNDTSEVTIPPVLFDDEPVITVNDENTIPLYGKEGDAISLSFVPKIDILSASVFFANQPMSVVNANNGVWTATYSVTDTSPSTLPQGNATVQIVTTDQNGNLNGHSGMNQPVILDTIAVELQSLDVSTNNPVNSQYAKNQDVITLTVTVNEHLSEINGHFEGLDGADVPITFNQKNSANTVLIEWESSFEINDTNIDHGVELQFTIDYYDIAGNSGTFTQNDLTSENVTVDFIPPKIMYYGRLSGNNDYVIGVSENIEQTGSVITSESNEIYVVIDTQDPKRLKLLNDPVHEESIETFTNIVDVANNLLLIPEPQTATVSIPTHISDIENFNRLQIFGSLEVTDNQTVHYIEIFGELIMKENTTITFENENMDTIILTLSETIRILV